MEKMRSVKLIFAAFRDNLTFEASASSHVEYEHARKYRSRCSPGTAQEKATYGPHNKMRYEPVRLFSESSAVE